jgi:DNA-binding protein HU-beta
MSKNGMEMKNPVINKSALVKAIAEKTALTNKDVDKVVSMFLDEISKSIADGVNVRLVGFGTFERRIRRGREGHNPRKPEEKVYIPAHYVPSFKAGKNLKEIVKKTVE